MNVINTLPDFDLIPKCESELVEQQKQEFKLLGTYLRTSGLQLFCYNPHKNIIEKVHIEKSNTCVIIPIQNEPGYEIQPYHRDKINVDPTWEYFECLNMKSALKRVEKYKHGKIKYLWNLRVPSNLNSIKLF